MAKILFVDDDSSVRVGLTMSLEDAGYTVVTANDGHEGLMKFREHRPDILISDVNMPVMDGFTLCRRLREDGEQLPIILLTSRDSDIDEALGLDLGADDYVSKPFQLRVLLARIAALLRRVNVEEIATSKPLQVGDLELDPVRLLARYKGIALVLTVTEFRLLESMASRPGVVFSRQRLLELGRGDDSVVAERLIDTYMRRLRRKLEACDPDFAEIETVVGLGYRWRDLNP
jgi:DNA-binding response OmpR family regulator